MATDNSVKKLHVLGSLKGDPGKNGTTFIPHLSEDGKLSWTNDTGLENPAPVAVTGPPGPAPYIGENGNWWIQETDTMVPAKGVTPNIEGGYWYIGEKNTEVRAEGMTPALHMGKVTTLPAGCNAEAAFSGTPEAPVLNLGIPEGAEGSDGGYYRIQITQPQAGQMLVSFVPSKESMADIEPVIIDLPVDDTGESGVYAYPVLTVPYSAQVELPVNAEVHIGTTEGPLNLTLGERDPAYSAEWVAEITQGGTAYDIILPVVEWVGNAPTFEADTVTQIRLFIKGETLMGVAV